MRSPWPNSHNSPAYQFKRGMPTGSASSQLSQWQRLNAGLSGPLAFEHDFSALDDPASSHDAAYASEPYDFHEDGTPPAQPIDLHLLLSRFRSLDLRVRVLYRSRKIWSPASPLASSPCSHGQPKIVQPNLTLGLYVLKSRCDTHQPTEGPITPF